jgi:hypothetical protein
MIQDVVPKLLKKADYDLDLAERGIVFLDNMDRIGADEDEDGSAEDKEILREVLEFIEGTEITVKGKTPSAADFHTSVDSAIDVCSSSDEEPPDVTLNTNQLFFICFGVSDLTNPQGDATRRLSTDSMDTSSTSGGSSGRGSTSRGTRNGSGSGNDPKHSKQTQRQHSLDSGSYCDEDEEDDDDSYQVRDCQEQNFL